MIDENNENIRIGPKRVILIRAALQYFLTSHHFLTSHLDDETRDNVQKAYEFFDRRTAAYKQRKIEELKREIFDLEKIETSFNASTGKMIAAEEWVAEYKALPPYISHAQDHEQRINFIKRIQADALAAAQPEPSPVERTPADYAIEHAEYMAKAVDNFLALYDSGNADHFDLADHRRALASSVYEFRKRAERAIPKPTGAAK